MRPTHNRFSRSVTLVLLFIAILLGSASGVVACKTRLEESRSEHKLGAFYDVRDYGAIADGKTKNTEAIRKAIAAAASHGGGTVLFTAGQYLTGPIHLKSNITLFVDAGAVVKFSQDFDDYLPMVRSRWEGTEVINFSPLIYADKVENIAIEGRGVLDGQGEVWWRHFRELKDAHEKTGIWKVEKWQTEFARLNKNLELPDDPRRLQMQFLRPPMIQFMDSKNISIRDVTIRNSPFWTVNPVYCDNLTITGVTIENPENAPNTDGIDPESCKNVHISNCHINVGDDCICIKSGRDKEARRINRPAENHTITNSTMLRGHGGVVIGSEMSGGAKRITISNCVFQDTDRGIRIKSTRGRGGVVEDVRVSNIVMKDIKNEAITLNLFYSDVPSEPFSERTPVFRNIHFSGITGTADQAALLLGLEESPLDDISFVDLNITAKKGFVIKQAKHITLRSVRVDTASGPALVAQDLNHLELDGFSTLAPHAGTPIIELGNVTNAYVHDSFATPEADTFARVLGPRSAGILVERNYLPNVKQPVVTSKEPPEPIETRGTAGGPKSSSSAHR